MAKTHENINEILRCWVENETRRAAEARPEKPARTWRAVPCVVCTDPTLSDGSPETAFCPTCAVDAVRCAGCGVPIVWNGRTDENFSYCPECEHGSLEAIADALSGK